MKITGLVFMLIGIYSEYLSYLVGVLSLSGIILMSCGFISMSGGIHLMRNCS